RLLDLQRAISLEKNEASIGSEVVVLIDRLTGTKHGAAAEGRTSKQALEVDGVIQLRAARGARPGEFVRARITGACEHDLVGELAVPAR
ncbi:MAG: TRAM domain-containing protein, partial [Gemmatimonadetes bacterium]|nr:TRAM domain-containing protein [Gemmatimonadota bacterium]